MTLAALTAGERDVIRRCMEAIFEFFDCDFHVRLGVTQDTMRNLLTAWPGVDEASDESEACLAINNAMNDLLHGVGISDEQARRLIGVDRAGLLHIYRKWVEARGWSWTGVR